MLGYYSVRLALARGITIKRHWDPQAADIQRFFYVRGMSPRFADFGLGVRRDEAQFDQQTARRFAEALKRRGVAENLLAEAMAEIAHAT
jgi:hypothetical protein